MQPMNRVQGNIVARHERRFLDWACARIPQRITSDHLTAFGVVGAVLVLGGYIGSRFNSNFLWLSALGYGAHWFGDSLDGSLARHRQTMRPRYGYFLDHSLDALCIVMMIGGMGLTPFVSLSVALFVVIGYFAMSIHVFLRTAVTGTFQLSFLGTGPTELRIMFATITLAMFAGVQDAHVGLGLQMYDIPLLFVGCLMLAIFVFSTAKLIVALRLIEGDGRHPLAPATLDQARWMVNRPRMLDGAAAEALRPASATQGL